MTGASKEHGKATSDFFLMPKTDWVRVMDAGDERTPAHAIALEELCEMYWSPTYAYLRRKRYSPEQSADLTQDFFRFLIEHKAIGRADPNRGRFRNFLIGCLEHFLSIERRHEATLTKGAKRPFIQWDELTAERLYSTVLVHSDTPEQTFEKRWALDLLERVHRKLYAELGAVAKSEIVNKLEGHLWREQGSVPYDELSKELGVSSVALRSIVHRIRQRYRELIRAEIGATGVPAPGIDDEICHLIGALSG